jgi:two-component system, OmpR family, response regulator
MLITAAVPHSASSLPARTGQLEACHSPRGQEQRGRAGATQKMRLLLIEDDREAANRTAQLLSEFSHVVDVAFDGEDGLHLARGGAYDVLIVDRRMPVRDGISVVETLRKEGIRTPAIFLTALTEVDHRVEGLKAGGDDYLSKPFYCAELNARIEAVARRAQPMAIDTRIIVGDLVLDLLTRKVHRAGQEIPLQPREFNLLEFLMRHAEQVVTRGMLLEQVWGIHFDPQTNVIDVHISRLRAKIDKGFEKQMVHTVRGAGYSLRAAN